MNSENISMSKEEFSFDSTTPSSSQKSGTFTRVSLKQILKCESDCLQSLRGAYYADPSLITQKLLSSIIYEGDLTQDTPEADMKTEVNDCSIPTIMLKRRKISLGQRKRATRSKLNLKMNNDLTDIGIVSAKGNTLHRPYLRKDVPLRVLYNVRGVRCYLCFCLYKGVTCVERLIQHTMDCHKERATPAFIAKLREDTTFESLIGEGIYYCTCDSCQRFGQVRCDRRLVRGPFPWNGMEVKHSL